MESPPKLFEETEMKKLIHPEPPDSPPPNCAICLGMCTNKCFTNSCLHQFCFSCLLEWSKIKAECPLCKKAFKSIIYNIKSNLEYEEHFIPTPERGLDETLEIPSDYLDLFIPSGRYPLRHYQYRTTFTLDFNNENAVERLLLLLPRVNSLQRSTHFLRERRSIYSNNLWVEPLTDVTGRFRDCCPAFFRSYPGRLHRVIPWLHRELSALLTDLVTVFQVQERITHLLPMYSVLSSTFRRTIEPIMGDHTDHFIHEFYNFLRSPYDMNGFDTHATYSFSRPTETVLSLSDDDNSDDNDNGNNNSDIRVVDSSTDDDDCIFIPQGSPEIILIESDSEQETNDVQPVPNPSNSPIIIEDSDSDSANSVQHQIRQPIKMQFKKANHTASRMTASPTLTYSGNRIYGSNAANLVIDSEDSSETTSLSSTSCYSSNSSSFSSGSETESSGKTKILESKSKRKRKYRKPSSPKTSESSDSRKNKHKSTKRKSLRRKNRCSTSKKIKLETNSSSDENSSSSNDDHRIRFNDRSSSMVKVKKHYSDSELDQRRHSPFRETYSYGKHHNEAGPSHKHNLRSNDQINNSLCWYSRPDIQNNDSDDDSD